MKTINILHTNDIHSTIEPLSKLAHYANSVRSKNENTLVVDGGDILTGTIYNMIYNGEIESKIINSVNYDIHAIGNHDCDDGVEDLSRHLNALNGSKLCSNIDFSEDKRFECVKNTIIKQFGDFKIGFCSSTTDTKAYEYDDEENIKFNPELDGLEKAVKSLRGAGVDYIIALNHIGYENDIIVANQIEGIDLIIGAHSHTELSQIKYVKGVAIVQTGAFLKNIGHIQLTVDNEDVAIEYHLVDMENYLYEDEKVSCLINDAVKRKESEYGQMVGSTKSRLEASRDVICFRQTNLGKLVADSFMAATNGKADFALINAKGVRRSIDPGIITKEMAYEVLPFNRDVVLLEIKGQDLINAITTGMYAQTANLEVVNQSDGGVKLYKSNGFELTSIDPSVTYKLATNSYLAAGYSYYYGLAKGKVIEKYDMDFEVLSKYIESLETDFEYTAL